MSFFYNWIGRSNPSKSKEKQRNTNTNTNTNTKPKTKISHALRCEVWNHHVGRENGIGLCYCCQKEIDSKHFECGHIISEAMGGGLSLENLRPICTLCNRSMGIKNMNDFRKIVISSKGKWYEKKVYFGLNSTNDLNAMDKWYITSKA